MMVIDRSVKSREEKRPTVLRSAACWGSLVGSAPTSGAVASVSTSSQDLSTASLLYIIAHRRQMMSHDPNSVYSFLAGVRQS